VPVLMIQNVASCACCSSYSLCWWQWPCDLHGIWEGEGAMKPKSVQLRRSPLSQWSRLALTALSALIVTVLNSVTVASSLTSHAGFPVTFMRRSYVSGKISILVGGLVLDVFVWIGIVGGVWYVAGRYARPLSGNSGAADLLGSQTAIGGSSPISKDDPTPDAPAPPPSD